MPYILQDGKHYYIPGDAWLNGWLHHDSWDGVSRAWGVTGVSVTGYGVLSGHLFRWKGSDQDSLRAVNLRGQQDCHIIGPTLVDFPNHHMVRKRKQVRRGKW